MVEPLINEISDEIYSVSGLLKIARRWLEYNFNKIWIRGEITNLKNSPSGHIYFSLKDEKNEAILPSVIWASSEKRLKFKLKEGMLVECQGTITIYEPRGRFQFIADKIIESGVGDLRAKFLALKEKFEKEGLLSPERKRPIPLFPRCIGIVTSLQSAALQDILKILQQKIPSRIIISPTPVQGDEASVQIITALNRLTKIKELEVVIIARGGGGKDELWTFNDELLARTIANYPVPVISAVGHEIDITLTDLVADFRAATPTEGAAIVLPQKDQILDQIENYKIRLINNIKNKLINDKNSFLFFNKRLEYFKTIILEHQIHLDEIVQKLINYLDKIKKNNKELFIKLNEKLYLNNPKYKIMLWENNRAKNVIKIEYMIRKIIEEKRKEFELLLQLLNGVSPLAVLSRGYALVSLLPDEKLITKIENINLNDRIKIRMHDGSFKCIINELNKLNESN